MNRGQDCNPRGSTNSRNWVFTLNNPTETEISDVREWVADRDIKSAYVGLEVAPTTGTRHLQGFIKFGRSVSREWVRRFLFGRAHIEAAKASEEHNKRYCLKDADIIIDKSHMLMQGHRSDLDRLKEALDQGGLSRAKQDTPTLLLKYPGGCRLYCSITSPSTERNVRVCVFVGPTGTGKSRAAHELKPCFSAPLSRRNDAIWMDGYAGEPHLILDDYYGHYPYDVLLRICDRYPMQVQVKGGFTGAHWTTVTITSNEHPQLWYPDKDLAPFADRIKRGGGKESLAPPYNYD